MSTWVVTHRFAIALGIVAVLVVIGLLTYPSHQPLCWMPEDVPA